MSGMKKPKASFSFGRFKARAASDPVPGGAFIFGATRSNRPRKTPSKDGANFPRPEDEPPKAEDPPD